MFRVFASALCCLLLQLAQPAAAFGFEDVADMARREAASAYRAPDTTLPADLAGLGYDALRDIRYRPAHAIWRTQGLPFELQFFHLGGGNNLAVQVSEVVAGVVRPLGYDPQAWSFDNQVSDSNRLHRSAWGALGHAGFRVHHALNTPQVMDELVVFLGASYFRALGRGQQYGLSARGLAIDTVGGAAGEEFPRFTAFWIERPAADATTLTIHALLDSPRATAAYRFVMRPGENTVIDVQASLFLRMQRNGLPPVRMLGIAPLTSMFLHGENQPRPGDFRPEVHDSDGLMVAAASAHGGPTEWLWRPLFNPPRPLASSFGVARLEGFGLMQRDRRFAAFEDSEARYDRRPSAWVEPVGDWGPGRVELLLLPTPDESHDNVAAYWVPAKLPAPGEALNLAWRLHWQGTHQQDPPGGWTVQSRRGHGWYAAATPPTAKDLQFVVDFDGPALRALPADATVDAVVTAAGSSAATTGAAPATPSTLGQSAAPQVTEARVFSLPNGGWRLRLSVQRDPTQAVELRAFLRRGADALTETWTALVPQELP